MKPTLVLALIVSAAATLPLAAPRPAVAAQGPVLAQKPAANQLRNAPQIGRPAPQQTVRFLVHLPLRNVDELNALIENQTTPGSPLYHHFLTPAQFRASYGPTSQTLAGTAAILVAKGFTITRTTSQFLWVKGPVSAVDSTFSTHLAITRDAHGSLGINTREAVVIPAALAKLGATVHGLHQFIAPHSNLRRAAVPLNRDGEFSAYWFTDLKQAYKYPSYQRFTGKGITIATVGASDFNDSDAALYFGHEKLGENPGDAAPAPVPRHITISGSLPFDPTSSDSLEADLDVQQANGSAPGATLYGVATPNPPQSEGFLYAYSYLDEANLASIVSTSYGGCELFYTAPYTGGLDLTGILAAYHDLFLQGNSEGITFVFSSGDEAGLECPPPAYFTAGPGLTFKNLPSTGIWVDDPNVTAVGGTNLGTSFKPGSRKSTYVAENSFADPFPTEDPYGTGNLITNDFFGSGGGESALFAKPKYQTLVDTKTKNRAVPDISMHMGGCPVGAIFPCGPNKSSVQEIFAGQQFSVLGTSASAPEFAGLLAVFAEAQGGIRFGNINPLIYLLARENSSVFGPFYHRDIPGYNGVIHVAGRTHYNLITGVGTPQAHRFMLLPKGKLASDPWSPSNP